MRYRTHEHGPLTEILIEPGAVIVRMTFDRPGDVTEDHIHAFDHAMTVDAGVFLMSIDGKTRPVRSGERVIVPAGAVHGGRAAVPGTVVSCRHESPDVDPANLDNGAIPTEWLDRLIASTGGVRRGPAV